MFQDRNLVGSGLKCLPFSIIRIAKVPESLRPYQVFFEVDIDLKLPIPLLPNDAEEKEVRAPRPRDPNGVKPVSKAGNSPPNEGAAPRLLLPRGPLRFPKKVSGSSKYSNENGSLPPKISLKTSSGKGV
uniref:Uncharacterized protein n=1 Tax=Mus spicilegus TaxID=10103 RepID=A0A8C6HGP1_MUSSI